jgi:hypothetical protein
MSLKVLEKKHCALVVLDSNHVTRSGHHNGNDNTITRIESRYPGSTYRGDDAAARRCA